MSDPLNLQTILNELNFYQMPEFQRPFVWTQEEIRDLIDTTTRGYSAGLILTWRGEKAKMKICPQDWVIPPSDPSDPSSGKISVNFVLDGQQRLRTLARTFGIDDMREKGFKNDIDPNNLTSALKKYPFIIFPSRDTMLNVTKNKRNNWVSFDIFLDLSKIQYKEEQWYRRITPDCWVSLFEIIKLNWKDESPREFSMLTEFRGEKKNMEFFVVECKDGKITSENFVDCWYKVSKKRELKAQDKKFDILPIRYISLNSLKYIENILYLFDIYVPPRVIKRGENKTDFLIEELKSELIDLLSLDPSKINMLLKVTQAVGLGQLTHYFSRINRAGVSLDVVDLLIASIYGDPSSGTFPLRTMLKNLFENNTLRDFFNLKQTSSADDKFKAILQIASLYFYTSLSDESILKLVPKQLKKLEIQKFKDKPDDKKKILIREALVSAIEFLDNKCVIANVSKLRSERVFIVLVSLYCYILKAKKKNITPTKHNLLDAKIEELFQRWVLRESLSYDLGSASSKPPERYSKLQEKVKEVMKKISTNNPVDIKEILDFIYRPPLNYDDF